MKQLIILTAATMLALFSAVPASACSCSGFLTIDSLSQLDEYDFIAHVAITDDQDDEKTSQNDLATIGLLRFNIIELFKGERIDKVFEYQKNSSCDIGVSKGEEWILFGKKRDGKMAIVACDRNMRYKAKNGLRDWKYERGFSELKQLKKLYKHRGESFANGKHTAFYLNGKPEIEETYVNGKLSGERKIWYPEGGLFCQEFYVNDTLDGKSVWFYPTGQLYDESYYQQGKHSNVSRLYYDSTIVQEFKEHLIKFFYKTEDSLNFVYRRVQVHYEAVYDSYGRSIINREYERTGKIKREDIYDHVKHSSTIIFYHPNGAVSSIGYYKDNNNFGHYQSYTEEGLPERGWDYDEHGNVIQASVKVH